MTSLFHIIGKGLFVFLVSVTNLYVISVMAGFAFWVKRYLYLIPTSFLVAFCSVVALHVLRKFPPNELTLEVQFWAFLIRWLSAFTTGSLFYLFRSWTNRRLRYPKPLSEGDDVSG